ARRRIAVQNKILPGVDFCPVVLEIAEPELWPLKIDQDADRPVPFGFDGADRRHELAHLLVVRMTHVDAKHVSAGLEQTADEGAARRGRPQGRHHFGAALPPHRLWPPGGALGAARGPEGAAFAGGGVAGTIELPAGRGRCGACSLDSVSCTVQARCSPVSTSKKPVRSKPRARQSAMPRIVNSLSRVHIKACPIHSPPWS